MRPKIRFFIVLFIGLAVVAVGASWVVHKTARGWFENDLRLRAEVAVTGGRRALVDHFRAFDAKALGTVLAELSHDERIMAAAACDERMRPLARTADYPDEFSCSRVAERMRKTHTPDGARPAEWSGVGSLSNGDVYVTAVPLADGDDSLGYVVLVQDLSFIAHRESWTRQFLLGSFLFMAIAASAVTIIAARLAFQDWTNQLRRFLRGEARPPTFQPMLGDVRDLVDRLVAEKEAEREQGTWNAERLRHTLGQYLSGERILIIANREPYVHERAEDGSAKVVHPASGLVTALEPIMRACSGVWIAHGGGSADRETADRDGRVRVPPGEESYAIRRVWLTKEEEQGYYYGFSNEGLWPLCHVAHARPIFRSEDFRQYVTVNQKFADALCAETDTDDPVVLVQDYHFAMVPRLIRERLPRSTVIMFWHIPWPNSERLGICPWDNELLEGMLGASIVGFHTQYDCNNFLDCVDRFLEARIDREENAVIQHGRSTLVRPYPISVDWPVRWLDRLASVAECRKSVFEELGLGPDALLGVGVDRLDYTKGIEERLRAVERLLERHPELVGRFTFVQIAAPSRVVIERYRELDRRVHELAVHVNERFGRGNYRPIVFRRTHHEPPAVFRYYRAADVCYVSSLHDGMNLVAKEFVASREDERGVLVLSRFTGAARELSEALIVNPYDLEEASAALAAALRMSPQEQRDRMRAMRTYVSEFNVYRWAGRMLVDAARLRRKDRISGRLTAHIASAAALHS
jgi:trehalose 6-phosphate synthase